MKKSTGSGSSPASAGRQTLRYRQSSLIGARKLSFRLNS